MTTSGALKGLVAAAVAGTILGIAFPAVASSQAPVQQGWWTSSNPGSTPVAPPPPPDVSATGLLVQGGLGSPSSGNGAYAALRYVLPADASVGPLTLRQTASSASTPGATLSACALAVSSFIAEQGGPIVDAPAYDCTHRVDALAHPDAAGAVTYTFEIRGLVKGGILALAILPGNATTRVALDAPGDSSLSFVSARAPAEDQSGRVPAPEPIPSPTSPSSDATAAGPLLGPGVSPASSAMASPGNAPLVAAGDQVRTDAQAIAPAAASSSADSDRQSLVGLVVAALVLGAVLYSVASRDSADLIAAAAEPSGTHWTEKPSET